MSGHKYQEPPCRHDGPWTSREAARRIKPHARSQREDVFGVIQQAGEHGATDQEIQEALGLEASSVTPRRGELANDGRIVNSGRTRLTKSKRRARVWVIPAYADDTPQPQGIGTPEPPDGALF